MSAQGVGRAPGTPPLRHAEALAGIAHPLAEDILELTDVYIRRALRRRVARLDEERRRFEHLAVRLRALGDEAASRRRQARGVVGNSRVVVRRWSEDFRDWGFSTVEEAVLVEPTSSQDQTRRLLNRKWRGPD